LMLPIVWPNQIRNESTSIANKYLLWYKFISHQSFSEVYYNFCDPILDQAAQEHEYDLFFSNGYWCSMGKDDLWDGPDQRESVFAIFKQSLLDNNKPFVILSGDKIYDSRKQSQLLRFVKIYFSFTWSKFMTKEFHYITLNNSLIFLETELQK
jgi:nicotinamide riboside kinase